MTIHETIRTMREIKKFTQEDMAEQLSISVNAYSKIERGQTKLDFERLHQIAQILQINLTELINLRDKGFVCLFSENSQNNSNYYESSHQPDTDLLIENERLRTILQHKDELIQSKNDLIEHLKNENKLLQDLVKTLQGVIQP